jgi:hypothetical protein
MWRGGYTSGGMWLCRTHLKFVCLLIAVACSSACYVNNVTESDPGGAAEKAWRITAAYSTAAGGTTASVRAASDGSVWAAVTSSVQRDTALHSSCWSSHQQHHINTWFYAALSDTARDICFGTCHHCVIRNVSAWTFFLSSYQCCLSSFSPNHIYYDRITPGKVFCFLNITFIFCLYILTYQASVFSIILLHSYMYHVSIIFF